MASRHKSSPTRAALTADKSSASSNVHDSALRDVARNGAWGGMGAVVAAVLGFALAVAVARAVGAAGSGQIFAAIALSMILFSIGAFGADTSLLWALPRDRALSGGRYQRALLQTALWPVATMSLLLAVAVFLLAPWLAHRIDPGSADSVTQLVRVFSLGIIIGPVLQCLVQAARGSGNVLPFVAVQQVGLPGLRVAGVALLLAGGSSVTTTHLAWTWVAPLFVLAPVAAWTVWNRTRESDRPLDAGKDLRRLRREFWRYSWRRGIGTACALALTWIDVLLVAVLASPTAAGIYAAASRFATSGQLGLQAMRLGISPQVSDAFTRGDMTRVQVLYAATTQWGVLVSWPIYLTLIAFPDVVLGWFGPEFKQGALPLIILSLAMIISVAAGNVGTVVLMSGFSGWASASTAAALCINVVLNLILIPQIGAVGAAVAWLASVCVENGLSFFFVTRRLHLRGHGAAFWGTASAVVALVATPAVLLRTLLGPSNGVLAIHVAVTICALLGFVIAARRFLAIEIVIKRRSRQVRV